MAAAEAKEAKRIAAQEKRIAAEAKKKSKGIKRKMDSEITAMGSLQFILTIWGKMGTGWANLKV